MLAEFGYFGALLAGYLIFRQLGMEFEWDDNFVYFVTLSAATAYGIYCNSLGRPLIIFMCLIMIPLATTELGTDGAISGLMEEPLKAVWRWRRCRPVGSHLHFRHHDGLTLFAGPIVGKLGPLGLLATSAVLGNSRSLFP